MGEPSPELRAAIAVVRAHGWRALLPTRAQHAQDAIKSVLVDLEAGGSYRDVADGHGMTKGQVAGIAWRHRQGRAA